MGLLEALTSTTNLSVFDLPHTWITTAILIGLSIYRARHRH